MAQKNNLRYGLYVFIFLIFLGVWTWQRIFYENRQHVIVRTETGFNPNKLNITAGDTVIFVSKIDDEFWPASDLHPTHGVYSEFDPKKPILASESWSFTFEKAGRWTYHDHLQPLHTGFIIVEDSKGDGLVKNGECGGADESAVCWQKKIEQALDKGGLAAAFDVLADFYAASPAFAADCHGYTHELGKAAYEKFSQGKKLALTPKTSYCGYGFYHGFMETLLLTSGDVAEARKFCEYVDAQLSRERSGAATACYHGIGHGTIDGGDPRAWGKAEEIIKPGIEMCERVTATEFQEYLCATGVFNSIEVISKDSKYGITRLRKDPFQLCHNQPTLYREPCYTNMIPAVLELSGGDFSKAAEYIEKNIQHADDSTIDGFTIREMVVLSLFHEFMRGNIDTSDYMEHGVSLCRSLPEHSRLSCVEGIADGHMKYGKPGSEYVKVFAFCANDLLRDDERDTCYKHILARLSIWYAQDERTIICKSVPKTYQKYCAR